MTFEERFLKTITVLHSLDIHLAEIGMSGCAEFKFLQTAIIAHGAETNMDKTSKSDD